MQLTIGTKIHGFLVRERRELKEISAVLYRLEFEKNGTDLIWLDRADDNKTFSIGFKTIPEDHTGIFHIIEHSVLNGSKKYPVKEPFVELLKSSLKTFLNAMTFSDKTMYPIASRNPQDFLNLMDVYLDAVFHPLTLEDPHAFRQEGWHYELDSPEGELIYNGVVFNEMKGAFSNPGEVLETTLMGGLFPDNCYCFNSGGDPDHIPELTYEQYLKSHRRFYHPSNARIFLDGEIDLDATLSRIAGFLEPYDRIQPDADIPMQQPVTPGEITAQYEIGPEEDQETKVLLGKGWVIGKFDDQVTILAAEALSQVLCGSNEAPLKKALLGAGLAQDVALEMMDGIQQPYLSLVVRNTSLEKKEQVWQTVQTVFEEQADRLDHDRIHAAINRMEFATKERSFGGLSYGIRAMSTWLYGGHPADALCTEAAFAALRKGVDEGLFEKLLKEEVLGSKHHAQVVLVPSKTLGAEKAAAEKEKLAALKASWSEAEINKVIEDFKKLRARQETPDTPEQLASMPQLSLKDIPAQNKKLNNTVGKLGDHVLLHQDVETDGIAYLTLHFSLEDFTPEELGLATLAGSVLGQMATDKSSAAELRNRIESTIGRFTVETNAFGKEEAVKPVLSVSAALLESRKPQAADLITEILLGTGFEDATAFYNLLRQMRIVMEQRTASSRNAADIHASSVLSARSAVKEELQGITFLRRLQRTEKAFEADGEALCKQLKDILKKVFIRERLTVSVTGPVDESWVQSIVLRLPSGTVGEAVTYRPAENFDQGFKIAAGVGYSARCGRLQDVGGAFSGVARVASLLLRYDYLWNEVRVKGGAYGTAMLVSREGEVQFSSYRDPRCSQSLDTFSAAGSALRSFCDSGEAPDKYIISTIGDMEPLITPRAEAARAAMMYFDGCTEESLQQLREEVLGTTAEDLRAFSHVLDKLSEKSNTCVIGGESILEACGDKLKSIENLQQ